MSHPLSPCRLPSKRFSWHWVSECERMAFLLQILLKKEMTVIAQYFECILLLNMFFFNLYLKCMVLTYNVTWSPEPSVNCHFLEMFTHDKTAKLPVYCLAWYQFKWLHIPVADPGEGPRGPAPHPLIFRPNWGPKGRKSFFWDWALLFSPPPPTHPPPPNLKVWIHHCIPHVFQSWLWRFSHKCKADDKQRNIVW